MEHPPGSPAAVGRHPEASSGDPLVEAELRGLERILRALPEPAMRRERLLDRLEEADPERAYALLAGALRRPEDPAPHLPCVREAAADLLREGGASRPLDYAWIAEVYARAAARGDAFVMRLLRAPGPAEAMTDPGSALPRQVAEIPLGVRRALARGLDASMLERLLLDPDATVIEHLLANPRITEDQVVRIAARRPVPASTLECIARSRRFGRSARVRTAVARNPYCPTPLAVRLLGALPRAAVREMAADGTLHADTRRHAHAELVRRRRARRTGPGPT